MRAAALMRWIHSRRMSPLRARRSRYAYASDFITVSLAMRINLRRPWLKPLPWRVFTSLPEPVYSKRRAAALCVFNFGIKLGGRQVYHTFLQRQPQQQV